MIYTFDLKTILSVTSEELESLLLKMGDLQDLIPACEGVNNKDMKTIQNLDYVTQSLSALAGFVNDLAKETPTNWTYQNLQAADRITLHDLADRFRGSTTPEKAVNYKKESGSCELF